MSVGVSRQLAGSATAQTLPSAARARKLHIGHFAFMRALVQGIDTRDSWDRYLRMEGEHDDIRNVNRTIAWVRDEFAAAAKRCARPGTARLVQLDARRIELALPTLEEFAIEQGFESPHYSDLPLNKTSAEPRYSLLAAPISGRGKRRSVWVSGGGPQLVRLRLRQKPVSSSTKKSRSPLQASC